MEVSWVDSHEDVMKMEEELLRHTLKAVKEEHGDDIKEHFGVEVTVPDTPFPRVTLEEAREVLSEKGHEIEHKEDLDPEGERMLHQHIKETTGHDFVFVTDYPAEVRPFYHMQYGDQPGTTKSFDLLWKGLEITTGSQREHRLDVLKEQARSKGLTEQGLSKYFGFFAYGCPPHGGCGIGLTRMLMIMLERPNVREVTYLYRGPHRLDP